MGTITGKEKKDESSQLPRAFVEKHHYKARSGWEQVLTKKLDLT